MNKKILPAFLSVQGFSLSDEEKRLFESCNPLGVCLFAKGCNNVQNKAQLQRLCKDIKETIGRNDILIAVDQEGGRVRRLTEPEFTPLSEQVRLTTEDLVREHAFLASYDLKNCGMNVNFAPVLDVYYDFTSAVLKGRCFAGDEKQIAKLGRAMVAEFEANGVCPCVKHLPGHGRAQSDPHLELPVIDDDLEILEQDFYPFKQLNNAPMGMVAHILLTAVDTVYPASESAKVIQNIIRKHIGFNGFLVSDAVMMQALKGSISERTQRTLAAGCDAVCLGNADFAANAELAASGAVLSDEAAERLAVVRQIIARPLKKQSYVQAENKYCATLKNIITYNSDYDATEILSRIRK